MSDLISRADAIEAVENNSYGMGSRASVKAIKALPSAEAVEVVRCRDCKNWHSNTEFCDVWSHMNIAQRTLADDYCSCGVREDGEE